MKTRFLAALAAIAFVISSLVAPSPAAANGGESCFYSTQTDDYVTLDEARDMGIVDENDVLIETARYEERPCPEPLVDTDSDGYSDNEEAAAGSNPNDPASTPDDRDGDGVSNENDFCPGTPSEVEVDETGCVPPPPPVDSDGDGVYDDSDNCENTPPQTEVDEFGCEVDDPGKGSGTPTPTPTQEPTEPAHTPEPTHPVDPEPTVVPTETPAVETPTTDPTHAPEVIETPTAEPTTAPDKEVPAVTLVETDTDDHDGSGGQAITNTVGDSSQSGDTTKWVLPNTGSGDAAEATRNAGAILLLFGLVLLGYATGLRRVAA